jgi:hypothetical protein
LAIKFLFNIYNNSKQANDNKMIRETNYQTVFVTVFVTGGVENLDDQFARLRKLCTTLTKFEKF